MKSCIVLYCIVYSRVFVYYSNYSGSDSQQILKHRSNRIKFKCNEIQTTTTSITFAVIVHLKPSDSMKFKYLIFSLDSLHIIIIVLLHPCHVHFLDEIIYWNTFEVSLKTQNKILFHTFYVTDSFYEIVYLHIQFWCRKWHCRGKQLSKSSILICSIDLMCLK